MTVLAFLRHEPRARWPAFFGFVARVPSGALALLLPLLALSEHMSAAVGGGALAVCRVGQAVSGPLWGRAVDRASLSTILVVAGMGLCTAVIALAVLPVQPWPLLVLAAVIGTLLLPMSALMRALWNRNLTTDRDRASATAFESGMSEGILLFARLVVSATTLIMPVRVVIGGQVALILIGVGGLATCGMVRGERRPLGSALERGGLGAVTDLLRLYSSFLLVSTSLGAFGFVLILASGGDGSSAAALSVAAWGFGSLTGLILRDRLPTAVARRASDPLLLLILMGILQSVAAAGSWPQSWLMAAAFLAGLPIASTITALFEGLQVLVGADRQSEYFAWAQTLILGGDALGALLAGVAFDRFGSLPVAVGVAAAGCWFAAACWRVRGGGVPNAG